MVSMLCSKYVPYVESMSLGFTRHVDSSSHETKQQGSRDFQDHPCQMLISRRLDCHVDVLRSPAIEESL